MRIGIEQGKQTVPLENVVQVSKVDLDDVDLLRSNSRYQTTI